MSMHNLKNKMENAEFTGTARSFYATGTGYHFGFGTTVGSIVVGGAAVEGWAKGALYLDNDASTGAQFWINTGSRTTASWKGITSLDAANTWAALQTFTSGIASNGRITTTDGVASGTARVVGGLAYANVAASDILLASAGASAEVFFANLYTMPADTLKAGSVMDIKGLVRVTDASGTDTLVVKLYIGARVLISTTAFDPSATTDFVRFESQLVSRAAPGAASSCVDMGRWITEDTTGAFVYRDVANAPGNLATNGALIVRASGTWSATTASTSCTLEMLNIFIH